MDPELLAKLYSEKPVHIGLARLEPTPEQLQHLAALWPNHRKEAVAKAIGVSSGVARRWYRDYIFTKEPHE